MAHRWSIIVATAAIAVTAGCGSGSSSSGDATKVTTPDQQGGVRQALTTMANGFDTFKEVVAQCQKAVEQDHQQPGYCQGAAIAAALRQRTAAVGTFVYQLKKVKNTFGVKDPIVGDTVKALDGYIQSLNRWADCAQALGTRQYFPARPSCAALASAADQAHERLYALVPRWQRFAP